MAARTPPRRALGCLLGACVLQALVPGVMPLSSPGLAARVPPHAGFFERQAESYLQGPCGTRSRIVVARQPREVLSSVGHGVQDVLSHCVGFFQAAVAGGVAAASVFPIDMAKTRMQACAQTESATAAAARTYTGTVQTITRVAREEGFLSLYRGLGPVLIGSAPEMAIQITTYEMSREFIVRKTGRSRKDGVVQLCAGFSAGALHTLASNPMEVLKVRGQVLGKAGGGLVGSVRTLGVRGLSQGMLASWALHIPFSCIYFPTFSYAKDKLEAGGHGPFTSSMVAGLIAGVAAALPTTPCDVVKTRLQRPNAVSKGLLQTVKHMYVNEGLQSFFVGVRPRVGRAAPYLAISLTGYQTLQGLGTLRFPPRASARMRVRVCACACAYACACACAYTCTYTTGTHSILREHLLLKVVDASDLG